jgi:hypothetical protein
MNSFRFNYEDYALGTGLDLWHLFHSDRAARIQINT